MHSGQFNRRTFLISSAGLALSQLIFGQQPKHGGRAAPADQGHNGDQWKQDADQIVQNMLEGGHIPSAVIGVVKGGQVAYVKGYGVKKLPNGDVPEENTVYYIGSLSKALTAVGAMTLVQSGKLDLDSPASQYIHDLPASWRDITVRQFMSHTSGIPDIPNRQKNAQDNINGVYRLMDKLPMASPPGTREQYNNFNFAVTGNLIEVISGMSYVDFMKRSVFGPLGMDHTGIVLDPDNHATGYRLDVNGDPAETDAQVLSFGIPSGGLATNVSDLLKLEDALRSHKMLRPKFMQEMVQPVKGFASTPGWFTRSSPSGLVVSKNGAAVGFSSFFSFVPDTGDAIIMLRNAQGKGIGIQGPSNQILHACCGVPGHGGKESEDKE
ncbi:MAG TPA: serine hydrolase domain-containing protein [Candidatus Angelobacter sp.]|nr:serine hydrolase domain-containing protein [Candidatus Angelobacter sp.]